MTKYENLLTKAYRLVEETNKSYLDCNNMAYVGLLLGIGPCMLEDYEGNGHCFRAVDDAIHMYYSEYPKSQVNIGFVEGLEMALDKFPLTSTFDMVFSYIKYELKKAEKNENAFNFNGIEMITDVKLLIASKIKILENDPEFLFWIEQQDEYFIKNYGYSISDGIEL